MKRLFQLAAIASMVVMLAGTSFAWTWDNHVSQAPNGKGEVLFFPYYDTEFGWETKVQVINTSLTTAAVAKVVVRSASHSQEVLDFFIFLTPTDMWEGVLSQECFSPEEFDEIGRCAVRVSHMKSVDNSTLISETPLRFANDQNPFIFPLQQPGCGDTPHEGYVEVYLAAVFDGMVPGMSKEEVYARYVRGGNVFDDPRVEDRFLPAAARARGVNTSILAGNVEMYLPAEGVGATIPATVLKNYDTNYAQRVIIETVLGQGSQNSMYEVEASLSKNNVAMPYVRDAGFTAHHFLFPTKKVRNDCTSFFGTYEGFPNVPVGIRVMDMEERVLVCTDNCWPIVSPPPPPGAEDTLPWENTFIFPDDFAAGWSNYTFPGETGRTIGATQSRDGDVTYTGAPVIPTVMITSDNGFSWFYGAWTDGAVSHTIPGDLPNYQYEQ